MNKAQIGWSKQKNQCLGRRRYKISWNVEGTHGRQSSQTHILSARNSEVQFGKVTMGTRESADTGTKSLRTEPPKRTLDTRKHGTAEKTEAVSLFVDTVLLKWVCLISKKCNQGTFGKILPKQNYNKYTSLANC